MWSRSPYLRKEGLIILYNDSEERVPASIPTCRAICFGNDRGDGVSIVFWSPVRIRQGVRSHNYGHTMGLIEVELGGAFARGEEIRLSYLMKPRKRSDLKK